MRYTLKYDSYLPRFYCPISIDSMYPMNEPIDEEHVFPVFRWNENLRCKSRAINTRDIIITISIILRYSALLLEIKKKNFEIEEKFWCL